MTIQASCTVQSASNMAFGSHTAVTANLDATSTIGVQCSNSTPYSISLSAGAATGATVSTRQLTGPGGALVDYAIYRDASHSQVWGATPTVDTEGGTGNGAVQNYTAYGRVEPLSNPVAGDYDDTIAVTVTY